MPFRSLLILLLLLMPGLPLAADTIRVEVSALSEGAKFIGDKTGGARITIVDDESGELLAQGTTRGGTGSTEKIMSGAGGVHRNVVTEDAAVFSTDIPLLEPRRVTVVATGPLDFPQAYSTASRTVWLMPGEDRTNASRIVLTLSGYIIDPVETAINRMGTGDLRVDLQMLCGCPVTPGGTWDADRISKQATLLGPSGMQQTVQLEYTGEGTIYKARFAGQVKHPHSVRIDITGMDSANAASLTLPLIDGR